MYPKISVVVLSYNRPLHLRRALESIVAQRHATFDVTVVDNRSPATDEIVAIVESFPGVDMVLNADNVGFAEGMNVGIAACDGDYVYLTEDDVLLDPGCLEALARTAAATREPALLTPLMYNLSDGSLRCAGGSFCLGGVFHNHIFVEPPADRERPGGVDVDFIPGSALFARREVLAGFGGFRRDFFLYFEDTELCARAAQSGVRLALVPSASVRHIDPDPGAPSPLIAFHMMKNLIALYLLHAPIRVLPEFFVRYAVLRMLRRLRSWDSVAWAELSGIRWGGANALRLLRGRPSAHGITRACAKR